MTDVRLTWPEVRMAMHLASDRYVRVSGKGYRERYDDSAGWEKSVRNEVLGAWGECAVAKHSGLYFYDIGGPDKAAPDVGPLHVRTTTGDKGLRIYPNDPDPEPCVLVVPLRPPTFSIVGWVWAIDGRRDEWVCHLNRGGHWVPQSALRPIEDDAWRRPIEDDAWELRRAV